MPRIPRRYSDQQREALAVAYVDRHIRPVARIVDLAARGELELDGTRLDAFTANASTIRDCGRRLTLRRAGQLRTKMEHEAPADAVEALRRRLVRLADRELAELERRKPGSVSGEQLRQLVRAVRELAAVPGRDDPRPAAPGQKSNGQRVGAETRGGLAGKVLAAAADVQPARVETREQPAPDTRLLAGQETESTAGSPAGGQAPNAPHSSTDDSEPGSWARAQVEGFSG